MIDVAEVLDSLEDLNPVHSYSYVSLSRREEGEKEGEEEEIGRI